MYATTCPRCSLVTQCSQLLFLTIWLQGALALDASHSATVPDTNQTGPDIFANYSSAFYNFTNSGITQNITINISITAPADQISAENRSQTKLLTIPSAALSSAISSQLDLPNATSLTGPNDEVNEKGKSISSAPAGDVSLDVLQKLLSVWKSVFSGLYNAGGWEEEDVKIVLTGELVVESGAEKETKSPDEGADVRDEHDDGYDASAKYYEEYTEQQKEDMGEQLPPPITSARRLHRTPPQWMIRKRQRMADGVRC